MPDPSAAIAAAVRAMRGESDLVAVMRALADERLARVIACAPGAHPVVQSIAALYGQLPALLAPPAGTGAAPLRPDDPALHDALARLIGAPEGRMALRAWAHVAPAGWGTAHAEALRDAVQRRRCAPGVAAALIGPGDESAALLTYSRDAAFAIRRWGQANHAAPDAWAMALAPAERDRLIATALRVPAAVASCLPWLPPAIANRMRLDDNVIDAALDAFAAASPTARTHHAAFLQRLIDDACPDHLDALTRLACAMQTDEVWSRVQTLIRESPADARRVVVAAPWDDLPEEVRAAAAALHPVIAAARERESARRIITASAAVFFAALDPAVWDALDADDRQGWLQALRSSESHLAVRSLGLRPEVLVRAALDNNLAYAAQRHARDGGALRWALLPVVLDGVSPPVAHALIAAMPTPPPDPGAFFVIASGRADPDVLAPARATLRTPADLALAVTLQRCFRSQWSVLARCAAVHHALRGRSDDDLMPFMPLLDDAARAALAPDRDALVERLARPDRRDALRRSLDRLATLPSAVAIPVRFALAQWGKQRSYASGMADALADALQAHGDVFLKLADALAGDLRQEMLPLPKDVALARALRGLAQDDLPTARRLAQALRGRSWRDALIALLHAPPQHAAAVWSALDDDARRALGAVSAVAPLDGAPPALRDPVAVLAHAAAQSGDADLRAACVAALTARPEMARAIWERLPAAVRQTLAARPACADLSPAPTRLAVRRERLRGRR